MKTCTRCGSQLERNPIHTHWHHCPNCDPVWAEFCQRFNRLMGLDALAAADVADTRGQRSVGGLKV